MYYVPIPGAMTATSTNMGMIIGAGVEGMPYQYQQLLPQQASTGTTMLNVAEGGNDPLAGGIGGAQVYYTEYENLPQLSPDCNLYALVAYINQYFVQKTVWQLYFDALDKVRTLLKYFPYEVNSLFQNFGGFIIEASECVKTPIQKNVFMFLREVFMQAAQFPPMDQVVEKFIPLLMIKSQCEKSLIRDEAKYSLNFFVNAMCAYDCSYIVACRLAFHKIMGVAEKSAVCLAKLIQNGGSVAFTKLNPSTLYVIMKTLVQLLDAKNYRVVNYAEYIVNHIAQIIGQENFFSLIYQVLSPEEQYQMARCISESQQRSEKKSKIKETFSTHRKSLITSGSVNKQAFNTMNGSTYYAHLPGQNLLHYFNIAEQQPGLYAYSTPYTSFDAQQSYMNTYYLAQQQQQQYYGNNPFASLMYAVPQSYQQPQYYAYDNSQAYYWQYYYYYLEQQLQLYQYQQQQQQQQQQHYSYFNGHA